MDMAEEKDNLNKEREQVINNLPHPYIKQIDCCDTLVVYCNGLKVKFGLLHESEDVARELEDEQRKTQVRDRMNTKIGEGKIETSMSNAEKAKMKAELDAQRQKKKGKKQKKNEVIYDEFNFDIAIIKNFSNIGINPPNEAS